MVFIERGRDRDRKKHCFGISIIIWGASVFYYYFKIFYCYSVTVECLNILLLFYCTSPVFLQLLYCTVPLPKSTLNLHPIPFPWVSYTCSFTSYFPLFSLLTPSPCPLVALSLFLLPMPLALFSSLSVFFLRFLLLVSSYGICVSLPGLFHLE